MPRPPQAACGHDTLYVCDVCGKCVIHCCHCEGVTVAVSINSAKAAIAIAKHRRAVEARLRESGKEPSAGTAEEQAEVK